MAEFFDLFPKITYSIDRDDSVTRNREIVTNIFVRLRFIREILNSIVHYYDYEIKDDETPEILAQKLYGDVEAHWIILMLNDIVDSQYDWPLNYKNFNNYIIDKYGSIETAKTTYHHYEKISKFVDVETGTETIRKYQIETNPISSITINNAGRGYSSNGYLVIDNAYGTNANISYVVNANGSIITTEIVSGGKYISSPNISLTGTNTSIAILSSFVATQNLWSALPTSIGGYTSNTIGGKIVNVYAPYRNSITNYDFELELNEKKRKIKVLKKEYYGLIKQEFKNIMAVINGERRIIGLRDL